MEERDTERKGLHSLTAAAAVLTLALAMRSSPGAIPPFDDLYHLKRIEYSAQHFPQVLDFDGDRGESGAFCPWPPLYDVTLGGVLRLFGSGGLLWFPPLLFAMFAAGLTAALWHLGAPAALTAGLTLALSPYLIGVSSAGHLDHHYVEPFLLLLIVLTASRRHGLALGLAIGVALLIQTALLVAAGLAFIAIFFSRETMEGAKGFALATAVVLLYRLTRPPGYPDSAWFLGYAHAALLAGAAVACALATRLPRPFAVAAGVTVALTVPQSLAGLRFFGGDPWLSSIVEFQPMFQARNWGTDVANLTGGALLAPLLWRRHRTLALFAIVYLLLSLTSRRFLIPGIALFAMGGALTVAACRRPTAWLAMIATLLPPVLYDLTTFRERPEAYEAHRSVALRLRSLPAGRVLAPWSFGHVIDVVGRKRVLIDNFGTMTEPRTFEDAIAAMLSTREQTLLHYCRSRDVRYLVLPHPATIPSMAATIGLDPALYTRTGLAEATIWSHLYRGERVAGLVRLSGGAPSLWKVE